MPGPFLYHFTRIKLKNPIRTPQSNEIYDSVV